MCWACAEPGTRPAQVDLHLQVRAVLLRGDEALDRAAVDARLDARGRLHGRGLDGAARDVPGDGVTARVDRVHVEQVARRREVLARSRGQRDPEPRDAALVGVQVGQGEGLRARGGAVRARVDVRLVVPERVELHDLERDRDRAGALLQERLAGGVLAARRGAELRPGVPLALLPVGIAAAAVPVTVAVSRGERGNRKQGCRRDSRHAKGSHSDLPLVCFPTSTVTARCGWDREAAVRIV